MSLFEVPLRFELNVTVRALIKLPEVADTLERRSSDLVLRRGFPLFESELSGGWREDFQAWNSKWNTSLK